MQSRLQLSILTFLVRFIPLRAQCLLMLALCIPLLLSGYLFSVVDVKAFFNDDEQTANDRDRQWQGFTQRISASRISDAKKVIYTQRYFNRMVWRTDDYQWGADDFWATPLETIIANGGDCEDLAIAKYFTLLNAGVSPEKLRVSYVRSLILEQAHVVLLFYVDANSSPWVIDNLETRIYTLSERQDLQYVYSFDQYSLWLEDDRQQLVGVESGKEIQQWGALLQRFVAQ